MAALAACSPNGSTAVKREVVGNNWAIINSDSGSNPFVALEQDDDILNGDKTLETQSFSLICDPSNGNLKAAIYPIARTYQNHADDVRLRVLATDGSKYDQIVESWENAYSTSEDFPEKYIFAADQDSAKLLRFMLRAYAEGKYHLFFLFPGDENGKSTGVRNGMIRIDIRIEDLGTALNKFSALCKRGPRL